MSKLPIYTTARQVRLVNSIQQICYVNVRPTGLLQRMCGSTYLHRVARNEDVLV